MYTTSVIARAARALAAAALLSIAAAAAPTVVGAQGAQVYGPSELTAAPKIASPAEVSRLITNSYPRALKQAGIGGTVEVEFVVGPDGKVETGSAQVVQSSAPALGSAAKSAVEKMSFKPGEVNGQKVRARVAIPIIYKAS